MIAAEAALVPGAPVHLGVEFRTAPGWHVYWKNPGDAGFPPRVDRIAPVEWLGKDPALEIEFPAPRRFSLPGGLFAIGYEGEVIYPLAPLGTRPLAAPAGAGGVRVEVEVDYLTCAIDCVPYRYRLALDLPIVEASTLDSGHAPRLDQAVRSLPRRDGTIPGVAIRAELAHRPAEALVVEIEGVAASTASDLFVEPQELFEIGRPTLSASPGGVRFTLPLVPRRTDVGLPPTVSLAFTAVGLVHEGASIALEARRELSARPGGASAALEEGRIVGAPWAAGGLAALAALLGAAAMALWGKEPLSLQRGLSGFVALGLGVACLRLLAERVTPLGLAGIELALLGVGLCLWLRRRMAGRSIAVWVATVLAVLAGLGAPWLAVRQRLPVERSEAARPLDSTTQRGEGR